jgi:hypothetical protein
MATITLEQVSKVYPGDTVGFAVDIAEMHCFDPATGDSIVDGRPAEELVGAG